MNRFSNSLSNKELTEMEEMLWIGSKESRPERIFLNSSTAQRREILLILLLAIFGIILLTIYILINKNELLELLGKKRDK